MIDHVSLAVRDLVACGAFYEVVLATIGYKKIVTGPGTIGFGKKYPELWLNERRAVSPVDAESGTHIALRAPDAASVQAFHAAALAAGGTSYGAPGLRPEYAAPGYYAAFVCDPEGNRIEAVTFGQGSR
jgi:catechol 2,3-dioxygenase-like lactoylglutathione lyase family enzyme